MRGEVRNGGAARTRVTRPVDETGVVISMATVISQSKSQAELVTPFSDSAYCFNPYSARKKRRCDIVKRAQSVNRNSILQLLTRIFRLNFRFFFFFFFFLIILYLWQKVFDQTQIFESFSIETRSVQKFSWSRLLYFATYLKRMSSNICIWSKTFYSG